MTKHRQIYINITEAAELIAYEYPNEHTHICYLLDSIMSTDVCLLVARANIIDEMHGK